MTTVLRRAGLQPDIMERSAVSTVRSNAGRVPETEGDIVRNTVVLLDRRSLIRECLTECLRGAGGELLIRSFSDFQQWKSSTDYDPAASVVILCVKGRKETETEIERGIAELARAAGGVPVVLMSDVDELECVVRAIDAGARGYIPTDVSLDVVVGAIYLIKAGGVYVPASTLKSMQKTNGSQGPGHGMFTSRQAAVVEALRQGKANKIIAYELNMCESTVKVHVRNIMKKLNAKNRTQVAYLTSNLFPDRSGD
jgi:DNA-binding NarL/FixJ family response regulator